MDWRAILASQYPHVSGISAFASGGRFRDRHLKSVIIEDDHADPVAQFGDVVVYDESRKVLENGVTYVTLTQKNKSVFVGRALRGQDRLWYLRRFDENDWYGPISEGMLSSAILGRVVAVIKGEL